MLTQQERKGNTTVNPKKQLLPSTYLFVVTLAAFCPYEHSGTGHDPLRKLQTELEAVLRWEHQAHQIVAARNAYCLLSSKEMSFTVSLV